MCGARWAAIGNDATPRAKWRYSAIMVTARLISRLTRARRFTCALCLCAFASATALAQEAQTPQDAPKGVMERGIELFLEGFAEDMAPLMEDALADLEGLLEELGPAVEGFLQDMGPALAEMSRKVGDWSYYELPEMLPNGDIIIRRRDTAPALPAPETAPDGTPAPKGDAGEDGAIIEL